MRHRAQAADSLTLAKNDRFHPIASDRKLVWLLPWNRRGIAPKASCPNRTVPRRKASRTEVMIEERRAVGQERKGCCCETMTGRKNSTLVSRGEIALHTSTREPTRTNEISARSKKLSAGFGWCRTPLTPTTRPQNCRGRVQHLTGFDRRINRIDREWHADCVREVSMPMALSCIFAVVVCTEKG